MAAREFARRPAWACASLLTVALDTARSAVVQTGAGKVRGLVENGIARFLGIPYAAPPFGENRFELPRPHEPWEGERDATRLGPTPPQTPYTGGLEKVLPSVIIEGEEVLNLNVWTPAETLAGGSLPVMVWIYGGALTRGSNALAVYDGTPFARDGVVLVSINYRVGCEGFAVLEGAPGNRGLADALAALEWVQAEIARFGGDPRQVTVFGQSAGGGLISALLAHPRAGHLFARAIIQSAPLGPQAGQRGPGVTERIAKELGVAPTRAAFAEIPPERLVEAQGRVTGAGLLGGGAGFGGVLGDGLLPVDPWQAYGSGAGTKIPVLVGGTAEEYRLYFMPTGLARKIRWPLVLLAMLRFRLSPAVLRRYRRNRPGARPAEVLGAIVTDLLVRVPANRFADLRAALGARTYVYEFAWRSPVLDLGAAHGMDVGFVFDALDSPDGAALGGAEAPRQLASDMHGAWVRFATAGDPGWPAWDGTRPVMVFDSPSSRVEQAPREDERRALDRRWERLTRR